MYVEEINKSRLSTDRRPQQISTSPIHVVYMYVKLCFKLLILNRMICTTATHTNTKTTSIANLESGGKDSCL